MQVAPLRARWSTFALLAFVALVTQAGGLHSAAAEEFRNYTVVAGDSCLSIATRELGNRKRYKDLHMWNPQLGPEPHHLVPGTVLRIAVLDTSADANLTGARGNVQFRKPAEAVWAAAVRGMDLFRAWRVGSSESSSADVKFKDASQLHMRENTVVIIYGPTVERARTTAAMAQVEKGALESRLASLSPKQPPLQVLTPSSLTTLAVGEALIVVDDQGTSWVGNHAGEAVAVAAVQGQKPRGKPVRVDKGMGSKVKPGELPSPPRPLPPAPQLVEVARTQLSPPGTTGTLRLAWQPRTGITRYRAVLRDAQRQDLATHDLPGSATAVEFTQLPHGTYTIEIAAIDTEGFESVRNQSPELTLAALALTGPGGSAVTVDGAVRLAVGSHARSQGDIRCAFADATPSQDAIAKHEGKQLLRCVDQDGRVVFSQEYLVAAIEMDGETHTALAPHGVTTVRVGLRSTAPFGGELTVQASAELTATLANRDPSALHITISHSGASAQVPSDAQVTVLLDGMVIDKIRVTPATPKPTPQKRRASPFELGGFVGVMVVDSPPELGDAGGRDATIATGPAVGLHTALRLHPRIFAELDAAFVATGYVGQPGTAPVLMARGGLAASVIRDSRYELRLNAGALAASLLAGKGAARADLDGGAYVGATFVAHLSPSLRLRAQLIDQVLAAPAGGFAHVPEFSLGFATPIP